MPSGQEEHKAPEHKAEEPKATPPSSDDRLADLEMLHADDLDRLQARRAGEAAQPEE